MLLISLVTVLWRCREQNHQLLPLPGKSTDHPGVRDAKSSIISK